VVNPLFHSASSLLVTRLAKSGTVWKISEKGDCEKTNTQIEINKGKDGKDGTAYRLYGTVTNVNLRLTAPFVGHQSHEPYWRSLVPQQASWKTKTRQVKRCDTLSVTCVSYLYIYVDMH
jgi:hypothetical protein